MSTSEDTYASGDGSDLGDGPPTLPPRLFASDSYPSGARVNIYSKANVIRTLYSILEGTDAITTILNSQFGKLFSLPTARCHNSAKLIHGLLSRQLVTKKKHEMWYVFGGKPIKFSLREFHITSGLRCSQMPTVAEIKGRMDGVKELWKYLFPPDLFPPGSGAPTVKSVFDTLRTPNIDAEKVLPLALLVIVNGYC